MVGQRHLARHRHVAAPDQPRIRDGVVGRAKRAGRDQRRTVAGQAGDAVNTRGPNGLGEGHRRQHRGEPLGEHPREDHRLRFPALRWTRINLGLQSRSFRL